VSVPRDGVSQTPAAALRETTPLDDAGAETADRYEWQAMMATADVLSAYFQSLNEAGALTARADFTAICEHHEDWALISGDESEIVSAKHREASAPPFSTLRDLLVDGGVLHLLERWQTLNRTPSCRLVTTGGLSRNAARVANASERLHRDPEIADDGLTSLLADLCQAIATLRPGAEYRPPDLAAFLISLRIQSGEARRDHLPDMAPSRYGAPIADRLGRPEAAGAIWYAVLAMVRQRMRAAGPVRGGALPTVLGEPHEADALAARTVILRDVDAAIRVALSNVPAYKPLPRLMRANRMAVKMARGGCSDNAIERAEILRLQYRRYWRDRASSPTLSDPRRQARNTLMRIVDETTEAVRTDTGSWGALLWREVEQRLRAPIADPATQGMDADLLLGGISDLSNNCQVWFTDRFDAAAELRRIVSGATQ